MSDLHFHFNINLSERPIMSLLNQILNEIASVKDVSAEEKLQVKAALDALTLKIGDLETMLQGVELIDIDAVKAAVADVKADVAAVYEPEPTPPVE
jgi:hypothetical protein